VDYIPVSTPSLDDSDVEAVASCVRDGWISSEGPKVRQFEEEFSAYIGRSAGVAVSNGTAAIDIALESLGIGPGDEVILPSFTIISCLAHILRSGATPVFVDSDPMTWNVDVAGVKAALTERTKAIIVVHLYGLPADIDELCAIAAEHGVAVVEDAAEAHGQSLEGKNLGTFGDVSTFSFYPNKLITTGEGGMLLADDPSLIESFRKYRNLAFMPQQRFVHEDLGWNYRMTAIQAALGLSQLARIDRLLEYKKAVGAHYQELLSDIDGVQLPLPSYRGSDNVYWVFGVVLDESLGLTAKDVMERLHAKGVGTRPFFYPLHRQPVLAKFGWEKQPSLPVAEHLGAQGFYVPNGADLTPPHREYVATSLREVLAA
jgi:perosamine synthetase